MGKLKRRIKQTGFKVSNPKQINFFKKEDSRHKPFYYTLQSALNSKIHKTFSLFNSNLICFWLLANNSKVKTLAPFGKVTSFLDVQTFANSDSFQVLFHELSLNYSLRHKF